MVSLVVSISSVSELSLTRVFSEDIPRAGYLIYFCLRFFLACTLEFGK